MTEKPASDGGAECLREAGAQLGQWWWAAHVQVLREAGRLRSGAARGRGMAGSINKCFLVGALGTRGIEVHQTATGASIASFYLVCGEVGGDGKTYTTLVPCEAMGKRVDSLTDLVPGTPIMVDGKLLRRKVSDRWETVVGCWDVVPISVPAPPVEAS